jgi:hypothetical protein
MAIDREFGPNAGEKNRDAGILANDQFCSVGGLDGVLDDAHHHAGLSTSFRHERGIYGLPDVRWQIRE